MTGAVILDPNHNKTPLDIELEKFKAAQRNFQQLQTVPDPEWLIEDVLPKQSVTVLWGDPAAGKSFIAMDFAMSVATNTNWFGNKVEPGNVLYVLGEGASGMKQRANAWVKEHGRYPEDELLWVTKMLNMFDENQVEAVKQIAKEHEARLVIIDTLARAMAGHSENDSLEMGKLVEAAEDIRDYLDTTVLFVHHSNTSQQKRMRGSSALKGAIDTELELDVEIQDDPNSMRILHCRKQKDAAPFRPINIHLNHVAGSLVPAPRAGVRIGYHNGVPI